MTTPPQPPEPMSAEEFLQSWLCTTELFEGEFAKFVKFLEHRDLQQQAKGMEMAAEAVIAACSMCNGTGLVVSSHAEHGCNGNEEMCRITCPVENQVEEKCEYCGRPVEAILHAAGQMKKGKDLTVRPDRV